MIEEKERQGIERRKKPDNQPIQNRERTHIRNSHKYSLRVNDEVALTAVLGAVAKHHPVQVAQPLELLAARHPLHRPADLHRGEPSRRLCVCFAQRGVGEDKRPVVVEELSLPG